MELNDRQILNYIIELNTSANFKQCFGVLSKVATHLGFDGVLYSYYSFFSKTPILIVSPNYGDNYLQHYYDNRLFENDHLIYEGMYGTEDIVYWFAYTDGLTNESIHVLETTKQFGINNGVSIRTFVSKNGLSLAGTSLICRKDDDYFQKVCVPNVEIMQIFSNLFHHKITANQYHQSVFIQPVFDALNPTKDAVLRGLASGQNLKTIASELNLNEKYVRNLAANLPKELGCKNREQLMYVSGMLELGA